MTPQSTAGEPQQPVAVMSDAAPTPTGPFSHAVRHGALIYTSGQAGRNRDTGVMGDGAEQVDWALRNIAAILESCGSSLRHVLKVTMILRDDVTDMAPLNEVYRRHFGDHLPARSSFFVSRLKNPDMLLEIEAVAVVA
jgi:2-iminobutanoate/2-iminopropanoate deaminase